MIVRKRKQLIQWDFLECRHAQNLQKIVERKVHGHFFLDDRNERINRDGDPDLRPYRVLRRSVKRFDPKILLNPAEKQFDTPAEFVELSDRQRRLKKVIGQKREVTIVLSIEKTDPPQRLGIFDFRFGAGQGDGLVGSQVHGFIDGSRGESSRLKIRLGSDDEKYAMPSVKPVIVQISAVQDVEGTRLQREIVEDSDIVRFSIRHMDKRRYRSSQIEKCMEFDGPFAFAEFGPRKKRETQVDRGGIEGEDRFLELQADIGVVINSPGFGDEDLREIGIDPPIAGFVGVGQVASRDVATDAHVVKAIFHGLKTSFDIAEAFPVSQLGEGQAKELIETREVFDFVIPSVTPDAFTKFVHRQESHDLSKDGRLGVHRSLLGVRKSADYTKSRSNRLRSKSAVSSVFRA
jgi:hypothetical protein